MILIFCVDRPEIVGCSGNVVGGEQVAGDVLDRWEHVLSVLEHDPMSLADQLDWVAKKRVLDAFCERSGSVFPHPKSTIALNK